MSKKEVLDGCPFELEYVFEAQKIRKRLDDQSNWELGMYIQSAVTTAVEHNLAGRKARSEYIKEPFTQMMDAEKQQGKDNNKLLMASLDTWAKNWKLAHKSEE